MNIFQNDLQKNLLSSYIKCYFENNHSTSINITFVGPIAYEDCDGAAKKAQTCFCAKSIQKAKCKG